MSRPEQWSNFDFPEVFLHWKLGSNTSHNDIKTSSQTWLSLGFLSRSSSALNIVLPPLHRAWGLQLSQALLATFTIVPLTHTMLPAIQQSQEAGGRQQSETYFRIVLYLSNSFKIRIYYSSLNASSITMHYLTLLLICKSQFVCCSSVLGRS